MNQVLHYIEHQDVDQGRCSMGSCLVDRQKVRDDNLQVLTVLTEDLQDLNDQVHLEPQTEKRTLFLRK